MRDSDTIRHNRINRRAFLKITAVMGGLTIGAGLLAHVQQASQFRLRETRLLMGTWITLIILTSDKRAGENALEYTFAEIERLIAIFDHRHQEGPVVKLNRKGVLQNPPPELLELIELALETSRRSAGAFDISIKPLLDAIMSGQALEDSLRKVVNYRYIHCESKGIFFEREGMSITLDGIAKGRVIDGGVAVLRNHGFEHVMVEAGGDLYASLIPRGEAPWKIGIVNPRAKGESSLMGSFTAQERGVATSGDYQHHFSKDYTSHHIIDPRNGLSPQELCSVTVLAPDATQADALSTTLMVLGIEAGLAYVESTPGVEALLISKSLDRYLSRGFPEM
jgi:thiamine biosynthesis lipoprotein